LLKTQANEAIEICEKAVQQYPDELRFQYQFARALQFKDRKRALQLQQKLVNLRYPAAHDNLGWLIISEQKNFEEGVKWFRRGVQLGDSDSMVSLAEMIDRGRTVPMNSAETKIALYERAARLGHSGASQALQIEQKMKSKRSSKHKVRPNNKERPWRCSK
jgi:TPR repeat protein